MDEEISPRIEQLLNFADLVEINLLQDWGKKFIKRCDRKEFNFRVSELRRHEKTFGGLLKEEKDIFSQRLDEIEFVLSCYIEDLIHEVKGEYFHLHSRNQKVRDWKKVERIQEEN